MTKQTQTIGRFLHGATLVLLFTALAAISGCGGDSGIPLDDHKTNDNEQLESGNVYLKEYELAARLGNDGLTITLPVRQKSALDVDATLEVSLTDLQGEAIDTRSVAVKLSDTLQTVDVTLDDLPADFAQSDKAGYLVKLAMDWDGGKLWGTRSLHAMYRYVQAQLLGADSLYEGGNSFYKLLVSEPNSGQPIEGAQASFVLVDEDNNEVTVGSGVTDAFGMADVKLSAPSGVIGDRDLKVTIDLPGGEQQEQAITPLSISREAKVLLTTDKPLYQPGQTIHLRALALQRPELTPKAGLPVLFTIIDPKGNKVFKHEGESSDFGVASTTFKLATLLNEGSYTLQAQVGDYATEKTVRVEKYALPKFNVVFSADRSFYKPGQKVQASIQSDYFFGKPVAGGQVTVVASKFDVEMEQFANVTGTLDANGSFDFDVNLPGYFVASALDENKAYAFFEISVTDTAGHTQIKTTQLLVVENPILIAMVPESGSMVPFVPNRFYLMSTDPFGRPIDADCSVQIADETLTASTGDWGLTLVDYTPQGDELSATASCQAENGDSASKTFSFSSETNREYVMVRTDKSVYTVGETIEVSVFATNDGWDAAHLPDRIYLDVIKDGQTMSMSTISLTDGTGTAAIDLDASMSGSVELMGYYLGAAGEIIRDRRLVFVELANGLTLEITPSKDTFKPAEEATIGFAVKDADNNGVPAAIGVQVVDEAVFALQDMQPGMEKVYFELEEELLTPRYEIHGFNAEDILDPLPEDPEEKAEREAKTGAFLASAGTDSAYGTHVDTFADVDATAIKTARDRVKQDLDGLVEHIQWMLDSGFITGEDGITAWIEQRNSSENPLFDPWGKTYTLRYSESTFTLESRGLDEKAGTDDDVSVSVEVYAGRQNGGEDFDDVADGGWAGEDEAPGEPSAADGDSPDGDSQADGDANKDEGDSDGPRVRSWFPETLYVNPEIITDNDGMASISFPMADSITSWRMTALANSLAGQLGSNVGNIIVFQDFFVDIDFPATLTQNDEVAVPIAIYNYLDQQQTIELEAEAGDWVEFTEGRTRQITVGPQSVTGIYFPVKVLRVGRHAFQVTAIGTKESDAIRRTVEVIPDGLEVRGADSGRLDASKSVTVNIPAEAIADASKLWVKIYPGLFSQVVEGLDSMLQMPSGCFEQTSSSTYPNILVLDYLVLTEQTTPEVELKARDYISQGYQRLLSYEVDGGGFEWFGETPAHRILTAYGLLEFFDMSKVHDVDEAVIARTQDWLAGLQNGDGSWDVDAGGIHEGATNNFTNSLLRTTAYIGYALAESGYTGGAVDKAVQWVKQNRSDATDNYTLAMMGMFLAVAAPSDSATAQVLNELYDARTEDEGGKIHWEQDAQTEMYGEGSSAQLETTALAGQAFIRAGSHLDIVGGVMDWLIGQKGSFGEWSTTQGTIQALRFFIASLGSDVEESNATISITANGSDAGVVTVNAQNSDVLQLVDLTTFLAAGDNSVELTFNGEGNLMYSVAHSYWLPSAGSPYEQNGPLSIDVAYDKTTLEVNDLVTATVTITNNTDETALMVLVDIGMPPGFDLVPDMLNTAVTETALQRFELAGRQLILYVERVEANSNFVLSYQMQARFPMEGSSGSASVAKYYNPEEESTLGPVAFTVTEGE